jgi:hypothetical protein
LLGVVIVPAFADIITGRLEIKLMPAMKPYCHIIRFPQGWSYQRYDDVQRLFFQYGAEYEFRTEDQLGPIFLVRGYEESMGDRYYTANQYKVDLSNAKAPILPATLQAWEAASIVPLIRKSVFLPGATIQSDQTVQFNNRQFNRTGEIWAQPSENAVRLSLDQSWLVLQSMSGLRSYHAKLFFDVFSAGTGKKILTFEGSYSGSASNPGGNLGKTAWVTERYLIVPIGPHKERCLVCEFGTSVHRQ